MKRLPHLISSMVLLVLLTACVTPTPASDTVSDATTAVETTESLIIEHAMGTTEVTCTPQRVVTLGQGATDATLALGVTPVGAVDPWGGEWYAYLADQVTGITSLGSETEPNLETMVSLKPDLIIGSKLRHEAIYDELEQIAPTVFAETIGKAWKENFTLYAQALCLEAKGKAAIQAWDDRLADFQAKMGERATTEVSLIRYRTEEVRIYTTGFPGSVLREARLARPESQQVADWDNDPQVITLSKEQIPLMDGDILFYMVSNWGDDEGTQIHDNWTSESLWQALQVVQNEAIYPVNEQYWNLGGGIQAANLMLDDLYQIFLPEEAAPQLTGEQTSNAPQTIDLNCEVGFRPFDHELLDTAPICIPEAPERIIALDVASVELTLLTGKTLLATSDWILSEMPLMSPQFSETLMTTEDVGYPANLEKILLLDPDIILAVGGTNVGDTINVEQALQIAPVVVADPIIYEDWKLGTQFWSDVLNLSDFYAEMEENYFTRVGELQAALDEPSVLEASVIAASTYGIYLWMPDTPPGHILADVGLARPEAQSLIGEESLMRYEASQYVQISEERLDLVDGDVIFYFTYASSDPKTAQAERDYIQSLDEKPLWQALGAVKAGNAFFVPSYWWRSQTYLMANKVIDDLFINLTDATPTTLVLEGK